jgi:hypothetical protein
VAEGFRGKPLKIDLKFFIKVRNRDGNLGVIHKEDKTRVLSMDKEKEQVKSWVLEEHTNLWCVRKGVDVGREAGKYEKSHAESKSWAGGVVITLIRHS